MGEQRKILIIGSAYPYRGGGISTFNERLARALMENLDDVTIYTFTLQYPRFLFPGKFQTTTEDKPPELKIERNINSINPLNWIRTGNKIKNKHFDIVIFRFWIPFMGPCFGTMARRIQKNKKTIVLAITDNIIPHEPSFTDKILSNYFVKPIDGFITMSRSVLEDLKQFDQAKPKAYLPHPLYDNYGELIPKKEAKIKLELDVNTNYILFFGFVREYKGLDILLKALNDDRLRKIPLKLLVAGEFYANYNDYLALVKELGLEDVVIMPDQFIPNNKIAFYFSACDIVVQPYKNATQSGVTQTAYHFNKPMITTDVGGLSEIVPNDIVGYVVKPDPKEVADALYKFYSLNKETEFSKNVKEFKKKYSWDRMIEKIDYLYKKLREYKK